MLHKLGMVHRLFRPLLAALVGSALIANAAPDTHRQRDLNVSEATAITRCGSGPRVSCVVDGDTFWYRGQKIRIADINTPEVSEPQCPAEARLGARATQRLAQLLSAGPFTLQRIDRDTDRYGRLLRIVSRNGESLGDVLVNEGLAERWKGYRGSWC